MQVSRLFAAGLALSVAALAAEEIPLLRQETDIAREETKRFEFGTVPQADTTVLLEVRVRLDAKGLGGSMYFMRIVLNGREVKAAKARGIVRLVNKPLVSPVAADLPYTWFGSPGGWRVLYAPDFQAALTQKFYADDPYRLVLDVTDLTNPAAENRLEITNTAGAETPRYAGTPAQLVLQKLDILVKPGASPTMATAMDSAPVVNRGEPAAGPAAYRGQLLPGGGFVLTVGAREFRFSSAVSYPNAGLNRLVPLAAPDTTGQAGWQPRVAGTDAGGTVQAAGPDYRLQRTVRFTPRKVDVEDALTNLHADAPLGLLVRHELDLAALQTPPVRLAGNPDPAVDDYYSPPNPTVHVGFSDLGIGIVCEDDVFRNQARLFCSAQPPAAGVRTEMLRLGPGETYALRWSVYPVAGPDYFDFINLLRQDWGANFTVEGAWTFFDPDTIIATPVEQIRAQFQKLGIRYACYCGGWVDRKHDRKRIGFGTGVLDDYWADFRGRLRQAAERIREAVPGTRVLVYYDTQRDTAEGGHERFRDSWLTDPAGNQGSTEWSGIYSLTYSVIATTTNSYGQAMLAAVDRYFDEIKADGPYWDEMEGVGYGAPLLTYNIPDGHSCTLDPKTYTIQREVGVTTLLGEGHRLAVIQRVRQHGGFAMGNGPAHTRRILQTKVPRMIEIQHNDVWCYEGNLGTPLGYASSRMDFGNWTRALGFGMLLVGTLYNYEHEISPYVFPFTPIELHSGYLLGQERAIVTHSGNYGWANDTSLVVCHRFDRDGKRHPAAWPTTLRGGATRTQVELAAGEAAVLVRVPCRLTGADGATLQNLTPRGGGGYTLDAAGTGELNVSVKGGPEQAFRLAGTPKPFELR